jgi:hypothetical protein
VSEECRVPNVELGIMNFECGMTNVETRKTECFDIRDSCPENTSLA